jgi:hypothetical protein
MSTSPERYPRSQCWLSYEIKDAQNRQISLAQSWYTSERPKVPPSRWYEGKPEPTNSLRAGQLLHGNDAELKAVNAVANAIVAAWPAANTEDAQAWKEIGKGFSGTVHIGCSQGPCHSCRWVVRQISKDLPEVTFYVLYPVLRGDTSRPVVLQEGSKASLYGEYGYQMAQIDERKNSWGVMVRNGVEKGYTAPQKEFPTDPPGGEPAENFDESSIG